MILVFAPYPRPEFHKDGYLRRVEAIDALFQKRERLYVEFLESSDPQKITCFSPGPGVLELRCPKSEWPAFQQLLHDANLLYAHSVYSIEAVFDELKDNPALLDKLILDRHGAVSYEETSKPDNSKKAQRFSEIETYLNSRVAQVFVSQNMKHLLGPKDISTPTSFIVPTGSSLLDQHPPKLLNEQRDPNLILYSGGSQSWQGVHLMHEFVTKCKNSFRFHFVTRDLNDFNKIKTSSSQHEIIIEELAGEALVNAYQKATYGFLIREDSLINEVACPTKLIEYISCGLIPILKSKNIGDLKILGIQGVNFFDMMNGKLPTNDEISQMREHNFKIAGAFSDDIQRGLSELSEFINTKENIPEKKHLLQELAYLTLHHYRVSRSLIKNPFRLATKNLLQKIPKF